MELDLDRDFERWGGRAELVAAVRDEQLARRIFYGLGDDALSWLDQQVPALGGRTPRQCLRSEAGRRLLRSVAAHFPL